MYGARDNDTVDENSQTRATVIETGVHPVLPASRLTAEAAYSHDVVHRFRSSPHQWTTCHRNEWTACFGITGRHGPDYASSTRQISSMIKSAVDIGLSSLLWCGYQQSGRALCHSSTSTIGYYRIDAPGLVDSGLVTSESSGSGAGWIDSYFVVEGERNKPSNACPP